MGRRVARVTPSGTDTFFYDMGGRLLATYRWSNPTQPELTTYFAGQKLGQYTDRVGSVRYARTGGVVNHYYPYGELVAGTNNTGFKFAETYRDDSGLDYAMARYYNSGIGRFLSVDRGGPSASLPQSFNRYAYVLNDPVNYLDPLGRDAMFANCTVGGLWGEDGGYVEVNDVCYVWWNGGVGGKLAPGGGAIEGALGSQGGGPAVTTTFDQAQYIATSGVGLIADNDSFWDADCDPLFDTLDTTGAGVSARAKEGFRFKDGWTSADTVAGLYANSPLAGAASGLTMTIEEQFLTAWPPIKAEAMLNPNGVSGANVIYLNSQWWGRDANTDIATVLHEILHSLTGLTDSDFERKFGSRNQFNSDLEKCARTIAPPL